MSHWDWAELAFGSKQAVREQDAIFLAAPRELSRRRLIQLIQHYLPQANLIIGLAKEPYVLGLENQAWFRTLQPAAVEPLLGRINAASPQHQVHTLAYAQRDLPFLLEKLRFKRVLFINGSWYHAFHLRPEYYFLAQSHTPYELLSPFSDEAEAKAYAASLPTSPAPTTRLLTESEMLAIAETTAHYSLAYSEHQTGAAIGRRRGQHYRLLLAQFNRVVPYQTYAMHHGATRERHFSPMNDLNHYDANHAEVEAIVAAGRQELDLTGTTLFINLLPCPTCARLFTGTAISEFVYTADHSAGYAIKMLEAAGKTVRRFVP